MKIWTIIKRELMTRVRTRGFVVFTVLIPVIAGGFLFMEFKIIQASQHVGATIAVVDLSHQIYPGLQQSLQASTGASEAQLKLSEVEATPATLGAVEASLRQRVLSKDVDGYLIIPADVLNGRTADFHARNAANVGVNEALESRLRAAVNRAHMLAAGIPPSQLAAMAGDFNLHESKVSKAGDSADNGQTAVVAVALVFILYMFLLLYGVVVMRSVTEEKTTRVSEVLLSSVDAFSLMMGKILGVVFTALAQFAVWGVCLALAATYGVAMAEASGANVSQYIPHVSPWLYVCFFIFFFLGFLLYSSIYAAIGAMVSSEQEAQQTQMPLTLVLVAALYLAFLVMATPSSLLSVVLSLIPFFAPVLMVVRVAVSSPPAWQVILAMVLCAGTFLLCTKITAKVYRVGILMTGKRPTLPELMRWLRYA